MHSESPDERRSRTFLVTLVLFLVINVTYVLASGPAMWLPGERTPRDPSSWWAAPGWPRPLDTVFRPLEWIARDSVVGAPVSWYWDWLGLYGPPPNQPFEAVQDSLT